MNIQKIGLTVLCLLCLSGFSVLSVAAQETNAGVHKVVLEAENFHPLGPGWRPIKDGDGNYMVDSIGASHISGNMLLSAPVSSVNAKAVVATEIPVAGDYKIWARYEAPLYYNCLFDVSVEQNGKEVFRHEYGRSGAIKLWFFGGGFKDWIDWPWGCEGLVCEGYIGHLAQGPAKVILTAPANPAPAANRNIDFVFMTTDTADTWVKDKKYVSYYPELDYILQPGRVYVKLTNESRDPCYFNLNYDINRVPWGKNIGLAGKEGLLERAPALNNLSAGWVAPKESTPWIDISYGDTCHDAHLHIQQFYSGKDKGVNVKISVTDNPSRTIKTLTYKDPNDNPSSYSSAIVEIPPYPGKDPEDIRTAYDVTETLVNYVKKLPSRGPVPTKTLFYGSLIGGLLNPDAPSKLQVSQIELLKVLGINAYNMSPNCYSPYRMAFSSLGYHPADRSFFYVEYSFPPTDANIDKLRRWAADNGDSFQPNGYRPLFGVFLGDEVGPLSLAEAAQIPLNDFAGYLRKNGFDSMQFETGGEVKPEFTAQAAASNPKLYVESYRYIEDTSLQWMRQQADKMRTSFGNGLLVGSNYSPHAYFWPFVADYVKAYRDGGLNYACEDDYFWQVAEITSQVNGYLMDAYRCGLRDKGTRGMIPYDMPHSPGNTDIDFRLTAYEEFMHGAKGLSFFGITPPYNATENYIDEHNPNRFKEIHDIVREAGTVDDLLFDGVVQSDPVAILLSESTELWEFSRSPVTSASCFAGRESGISTAYNEERKCLWYVLRHGHIQPDFLIEEDLPKYLDKYKVLYVVGDHIATQAAQAIKEWVKKGGILFSVAGGGFLDEYNQPLSVLNDVYGITSQSLTKKDVYIRSKIELPRLAPLDTVTVGADTLKVLAFKQTFNLMPGTVVLGRYADGSPAFIKHIFGKGEAYLMGTMPSLYYVQQALLPLQPPDRGPYAHFHPFNFNPVIRTLLLTPIQAAGIVPRVDVSDPLVETNKLASREGILLPVANYGKTPVHKALFTVQCGKKISAVKSMNFGGIHFQQNNGVVTFILPVNLTDFITLKIAD